MQENKTLTEPSFSSFPALGKLKTLIKPSFSSFWGYLWALHKRQKSKQHRTYIRHYDLLCNAHRYPQKLEKLEKLGFIKVLSFPKAGKLEKLGSVSVLFSSTFSQYSTLHERYRVVSFACALQIRGRLRLDREEREFIFSTNRKQTPSH